MTGQQKGIYFPNLNGLRFIAALVVLVHHIDVAILTRLRNFDIEAELFHRIHLRGLSGYLGVILFFVLSGFLITYLLLAEKEKTKTINIKNFYIRRVLRIWPLYFLVLIGGVIVLLLTKTPDYSLLGLQILGIVLFLPHIYRFFIVGLGYTSHNWSIGVEEQFYFIWPVVLKKIALAYLLPLISCLIVIIIIVKAVFADIGWLVMVLNMDHMMIGSLFALLFYQKEKYAKICHFCYAVPVQLIAYLVLLVLIITGFVMPFLKFEIYAICFGILIFNVATNPNNFIHLEQPLLNYLGKISYGIYMLHPFCLLISEKTLDYLGFYESLLVYLLTISSTIVAAMLSYRFFERRFLRLKDRFSTISSGDLASQASPVSAVKSK